ncbi:hypothetical protein Slin14017_G000370 [Septoria linicola]|nr:hypothetical protein Slin14017_G000370 [Septoria linicola]
MSTQTLGQADYANFCPVINDETVTEQGQSFRWRCTNEPAESATQTPPAAIDSAIPTPTPTISSVPSPGLSSGAKAGTAAGAILAIALVGGGVFFAYRRRRGNKGYAGKSAHEASPELETKIGH